MAERGSSDDKEVASLISDKNKKLEDAKKMKPRSPSQSPTTVQKCENLLPLEEREKWKSSSKWIKDIEEGYFAKVEKQFEADLNGCGLENGIELDTSGCNDDDERSGNVHTNQASADPAAVAAEYWQEVSAKANVSNSRAPHNSDSGDHGPPMGLRPASLGGDRSTSNSPASSMRSHDQNSEPKLLVNPFGQVSSQRYSPRPDLHGGNNTNFTNDARQTRSPGILYRPPGLRPSGSQQGNRVQTGYLRNTRYENNRDFEQVTDNFREMRVRGEPAYQQRRFPPINLGPYEELFRNPLPGNVKFIDSHAHWCFAIKKLQSQGIETYRDMRSNFPEMFPPSYGGSIQVFCLPLYLKSYDHWYRKLIEGTENEVWFTYGCHPNFVDDWNDDVKNGMLYSMTVANENKRLVGLGEIGLDYNRQNNNEQKKNRQRDVFRIQLEMAVRRNLPVVIHCRNDEGHGGSNQAELDCFEIMKEKVPHNWPIHRHCFRGSFHEANKWMDQFSKVAFGFTPCIAGSKDMTARDSVRQLPLDRILLETDAPYYTPAAMNNFPQESSGDKQPRKVAIPGGLALVTAYEVSKLKDIPLEVVVQQTRENTIRLYEIAGLS